MANEIQQAADSTVSTDRVSVDRARESLSQLAMTLYQCKDGSLVQRPAECTGTVNALPSLTIG